MRITLIAVGSTGDVCPFIVLGKELSSRGHRITIAAFSRFSDMILDNGFDFFQLGGNAETFMESFMQPDTNGLRYIPRFERGIRSFAPALIRDMSESCRNADALVCNYFGSINYSIAEKYDIPCIQTYFFPMDPTQEMPISSIRRQNLSRWLNKKTYQLGYLLIGSVEKRYLQSWRTENHLTLRKPRPYPDYRIGNHIVPVIYAFSPLLIQRPPEWPDHIHISGFWFEESPPAGWVPSEDLNAFLSSGDQPVYIGFGSMNSRGMNSLFDVILRAVHLSGIRAVISTGWMKRQFPSDRQVFFTEYVPHDWLFPRVRAVVHHGGAGTTSAGLRYGKPTLVIPVAGDQHFWAYHVYRSGFGPKPIPLTEISVAKITEALLDLVSRKKYQDKAFWISTLLSDEHGTRNAADLIEKEITDW